MSIDRHDRQAERPWNPVTARARLTLMGLEGVLIPLALFFGWLVGRPALETLAWTNRAWVLGIAATLPPGLLFAAVQTWPVGPLRRLQRTVDELLIPLFREWSVAELVAVSLLAGVGEEMLFRGVLQAALSELFGPIAGWLVASAIFGLVHFISPLYAVFATLMGLYLGLLWSWSGNLLVPIATHGLYDFVVLLSLTKLHQPRTRPLSDS